MFPILYTILTVVTISILIFIAYVVSALLGYKQKVARNSPEMKRSNASSMFDMVDIVLSEMNKIGEEQVKILKEIGVTDQTAIEKVIKPVRDRYDKVKWAKDNKGWAMPLMDIGGKWVQDILKGFIK